MIQKLKMILPLLSAALVLPVGTATAAESNEVLCDATQASNNELPMLAKSCPVGNGLWGRKPSNNEGLFWIQCGVFGQPLPLAKAKSLYSQISADVWMKPEDKGYRCLIGPYQDFTEAAKDLSAVKKQTAYKQSFIREVGTSKQAGSKRPVAKAVPAAKPKAQPKPQQKTKPQPASKPVSKPMPVVAEKNVSSDTPLAIRRTTELAGNTFSVVYAVDNKQFYMEHELPWNRMDYEQATSACNSLGMGLATEKQWKTLLDSKVMQQDKWPMHLPYWGLDRKGLFTSGKVNQLKGTSLLNVMCVK